MLTKYKSGTVAATTFVNEEGSAIKVVDSIDGGSFRLTLHNSKRRESIVLTNKEWSDVVAALVMHEMEKISRQQRKERAIRELQ